MNVEESTSQVGGTAHVPSSSVRIHPRRVYFESCPDAAVCETERNAESEVYPGLLQSVCFIQRVAEPQHIVAGVRFH